MEPAIERREHVNGGDEAVLVDRQPL
jgi:hypothetical protein